MTRTKAHCESARVPERDPPRIETPVIDLRDLEHKPAVQTRASDAGVEVLPQLDLSKEDEKATRAIEELDALLKNQTPGWGSPR